MIRGLGCLEDKPHAHGNWDASQRLRVARLGMPECIDWTGRLDWIRDQGASNACLGFAFARALQLSRRAQGEHLFELPSALHIYDMARGIQGRVCLNEETDEQLDDGARPECAAIALQRYGFCGENVCPWDERRVRFPLHMHEYMGAIEQRAVLSHRIVLGGADRVAEIRSAIALGHGGFIGMDVDEAFCEWTDVIPWTGLTGRRLGGHAMAWIGYDPFSLWVVNSWGDDWGDEGIGRIAWSVIASDITRSAWVVDSVPSYVPQRF